jgi:hypothetical protein
VTAVSLKEKESGPKWREGNTGCRFRTLNKRDFQT